MTSALVVVAICCRSSARMASRSPKNSGKKGCLLKLHPRLPE